MVMIFEKLVNRIKVFSIIFVVLYLVSSTLAVELDDKNSAYPAIWHVPHRNENFIGRSSELNEMINYFKDVGVKILPLTGGGGMGKTQLAKQYAHLYKQSYDIVWWFDVKKDLVVQIKELAEALNARVIPSQKVNLSYKKDEAIVAYVKNQLRTNKKNWLLIFDDTKDIQGILVYLPDQHASSKGHIIITSRNNWAGYKTIKLNEFLRHDSIQLINGFLSNERQSEKEKLAILFGDYPLAIVQAISYIKAVPSLSIADYLQLYNSERVKLWEKEQQILAGAGNMKTTDNYNESTAVTLSMTMQEIGSNNEQALKLLKFCSMLDNENIPLSIMQHYITDQLVLNEAIATLISHNILEFKNETPDNDSLYRMHEMVQLIIRDQMNVEEKKEYIIESAKGLSYLVPTQIDRLVPMLSYKPYLLYNIKRISEDAMTIKYANNDILGVYIRYLQFFLSGKRDLNYSKKILSDIDKMLGFSTTYSLSAVNIARIYIMRSVYVEWSQNNYVECIKLANKALEQLKGINGVEEEYVMAFNRLMQNYYSLGNLDKALYYADLAMYYIENHKGFLGNIDAYYGIKSRIMIDKGEFYQALELAERAWDSVKEIADNQNIIGYYPLHILKASILIKLGDFHIAQGKLIELERGTQKFFGIEDHPLRVTIYYLLATVNNELEEVDKAEQQIDQAITSYAKLYGANIKNRHTAFMHTVRGDIYAKQNKYDEAQKEYFLAEEIYKSVLKNIKIDDVSSLYMKISINAVKRKDPLVTKYYFDLHKETFGEEHPRNLELIMYLTKNGLPMP